MNIDFDPFHDPMTNLQRQPIVTFDPQDEEPVKRRRRRRRKKQLRKKKSGG